MSAHARVPPLLACAWRESHLLICCTTTVFVHVFVPRAFGHNASHTLLATAAYKRDIEKAIAESLAEHAPCSEFACYESVRHIGVGADSLEQLYVTIPLSITPPPTIFPSRPG